MKDLSVGKVIGILAVIVSAYTLYKSAVGQNIFGSKKKADSANGKGTESGTSTAKGKEEAEGNADRSGTRENTPDGRTVEPGQSRTRGTRSNARRRKSTNTTISAEFSNAADEETDTQSGRGRIRGGAFANLDAIRQRNAIRP